MYLPDTHFLREEVNMNAHQIARKIKEEGILRELCPPEEITKIDVKDLTDALLGMRPKIHSVWTGGNKKTEHRDRIFVLSSGGAILKEVTPGMSMERRCGAEAKNEVTFSARGVSVRKSLLAIPGTIKHSVILLRLQTTITVDGERSNISHHLTLYPYSSGVLAQRRQHAA